MLLSENISGRKNNLDLIRFIAAVMVIYAHSFPIVLGEGSADHLARFSRGQMSFGNLAVCIFFLFSGFFITKSVIHRPGVKEFFSARIKRLFPPLIVVVLACVFVLGPLMTELSARAYFSSGQTWKYLGNICLLLIHELPGVFTHNPYDASVNGVLWTLPVEVICYVICFLFRACRLLDSRRMKMTIPVFIVLYITGFLILHRVPLLQAAMRPCGMFYAGMLAYVYRDRIRLIPAAAVGGIVLFLIGLRMGWLEPLLLICLPYPLLYFSFGTRKKCDSFGKYGDFSYGMYLTAWPIAQCLVQFLGSEVSSYVQALLTFVFSVLCGALLFRFVERPLQNK